MTTLARKTQKLFAATAADVGQFGSAQAGTDVITTDPAVIQALAAWGAGWLSAVLGANKFPALEEMNGIQYVNTYQLVYLLQEGIPEYDAGTTYSQYGICKAPGTFNIYGSLVANNLGNALTNPTYWQLLGSLANIPSSTALLAANNLSDLGALATALTNLGFSGGSTSGYQKLPGGLIIQWGSVTTGGSGTATATFPITFPHAILSVTQTLQESGTQWYSDTIASSSASGYSMAVGVSYSNGVLAGGGLVYDYIALGY
jgi:hypothetical protein